MSRSLVLEATLDHTLLIVHVCSSEVFSLCAFHFLISVKYTALNADFNDKVKLRRYFLAWKADVKRSKEVLEFEAKVSESFVLLKVIKGVATANYLTVSVL